jgi:hypothetical protein
MTSITRFQLFDFIKESQFPLCVKNDGRLIVIEERDGENLIKNKGFHPGNDTLDNALKDVCAEIQDLNKVYKIEK